MADQDISRAKEWYQLNFDRAGLCSRLNDTFISVEFKDSILYPAMVAGYLNNTGQIKLAVFREEIDTETALFKIQQTVSVMGKQNQVKCHMVGEPLYPLPGLVAYTTIFMFHMAPRFSQTMSRALIESGILGELTQIMIWQRSQLPKKPWESGEKGVFKPAGLKEESKIFVIFLILAGGLGFGGVCFVGEIMLKGDWFWWKSSKTWEYLD
jgi:hypothetical protein